MKINLDLKIEKPGYFTITDITYAQVDAWFGHTTRDLKLDLIYPQSRMKKSPALFGFAAAVGYEWINPLTLLTLQTRS